jgi:hypothetical protein
VIARRRGGQVPSESTPRALLCGDSAVIATVAAAQVLDAGPPGGWWRARRAGSQCTLTPGGRAHDSDDHDSGPMMPRVIGIMPVRAHADRATVTTTPGLGRGWDYRHRQCRACPESRSVSTGIMMTRMPGADSTPGPALNVHRAGEQL